MFVSKQVIEKLEGEQTRLRREVKYLRIAAERGDASAVRAHAEDLASRLENHASLVDAVIEAVSEDSVSEDSVSEDSVSEDSVSEDSVSEDSVQPDMRRSSDRVLALPMVGSDVPRD